MNDKNELSDIVLDKNKSSSSNKKIILAVATLGVVLIVVVMLMNSLSSNGTDNLPQASIPPEPQENIITTNDSEPLFEDVEVIEEDLNEDDTDLEQIAQKLKEESVSNEYVEDVTPVFEPKPKKQEVKKVIKHDSPKKQTVATHKTTTPKGSYYIQVGSFSKYKPNKRFLDSITKLGFNYTYHKVNKMSKVLVGPFETKKEASRAKKVLRAKVEAGAFLVKL